jgi:uncharacterized protein (TIGR02996 family)
MSDEAAFLSAIRSNPDDDLPRLVYADWLDETGDPARAEFIRTQIELAKLPDHDPRYRGLEDREHEAGWFVERTGVREWEWRRGFLRQVTADVSGIDVLSTQPVEQLNLCSVGATITEEEWRLFSLHGFRNGERLHTLDTTASSMTSFETTQWVSAQTLPQLRDLRVSAHRDLGTFGRGLSTLAYRHRLQAVSITPQGLGTPPRHEPLEVRSLSDALAQAPISRLAIPDTNLTSNGLRTLLTAPFAGMLKHLDISDNPIAPDAYRAFQQCHPNMRLDKLDVSGTPLAGISLEPLLNARSLQSLTKLEMNGCGSARRNMEVLANSAFWSQATELRAHSGTIPASTLEPLCGSAGPPALRLLDLADNYLRTEGVRMLCDSPWAGSLTWLALSRNYLDNESCEVLAKSGRFTNLRTLHLAHHNGRQEGSDGEVISDRGVMALAGHPSLANLRLLTLSHTGITAAAVDHAVNGPHWQLFGLGVSGCNLGSTTAKMLAASPRLARLVWLDISDNPQLGGQALRPLAESPYLSPMCELDCGGIAIDDDVRAIFRERLGTRFSH